MNYTGAISGYRTERQKEVITLDSWGRRGISIGAFTGDFTGVGGMATSCIV